MEPGHAGRSLVAQATVAMGLGLPCDSVSPAPYLLSVWGSLIPVPRNGPQHTRVAPDLCLPHLHPCALMVTQLQAHLHPTL